MKKFLTILLLIGLTSCGLFGPKRKEGGDFPGDEKKKKKKKCKLETCHVRTDHMHEGGWYKGKRKWFNKRWFFFKKNPATGEGYKKKAQDPHNKHK